MAKKFLDFTGLSKYDELIKGHISTSVKDVQDDLDTRKVKDTEDSETISWTKEENGVYKAAVTGDVVVDKDYNTVKANANNSAAAWTKFLQGAGEIYPNGITPVLVDLATKKYADDAADAAKSAANLYADGLAKNYDAAGSAATAEQNAKNYADSLASNYDAAGSAATAEQNAKNYADSLASNYDAAGSAAAAQAAAEKTAKDYADSLASNYDAAGSAAGALQDAKDYADSLASNYDAAGSAASAAAGALQDAKDYTDGEIKDVNDRIDSINTAIAGGVHFIGISSTEITDKGTQTPTIEGWAGPVNKGDIVINNDGEEFIWDGSAWQKLGDTTAELERIADLEENVGTLMGDETKAGSVAKALKDAKDYTDSEITTLVGASGQVGKNTAAIAILNGDENTAGSVAKALKDAKSYADTTEADANSYTDGLIQTLVGSTGQVGINSAAIDTLNGNAETVGSVDYKIAQAVADINSSIDSITDAEIEGLFA